jgi:hypothetical protein
MRELFKDIIGLEGIRCVLLITFAGNMAFKHYVAPMSEPIVQQDWKNLVSALKDIKECDVICQNGRIYIRRSAVGFLLTVMDPSTPIAMLRLNCDILLPELKPEKESRGLKRFFKK